jgi:thiazole synthase
MSDHPSHDPLIIAGREFRSRLWVGTGKYKNFEETRQAIEASGGIRIQKIYWTTSTQRNTPSSPIPQDVIPSRMQFVILD